jgi:hypothetical protein
MKFFIAISTIVLALVVLSDNFQTAATVCSLSGQMA